jgi:hypothetical protein
MNANLGMLRVGPCLQFGWWSDGVGVMFKTNVFEQPGDFLNGR